MPEQQADYDTETDTQPTPGPAWAEGTYVIASPNDGRPNGEVILGPRSYGNDISADEQRANAELCAAAFTAASELPEEYDAEAAVEVLDDLLAVAELLQRAGHRPTCAMYGSSSDTCTCGWKKARDAYATARGYSDE
jgi:hypothetical protein